MAPKRDVAQPIAIIGMGMRLPGGVSTAEDFWSLLINKQDGRCPVPDSRYNRRGFIGDKSRKEIVATEYGYFLKDVNLKTYDSSFAPTTQSEAQIMDPQQRLLLEVVWECIENAGSANLQGTNAGVFVGCFGEDWNNIVHQDTQTSGTYRVLGTSDFTLSNRISYLYDLRGPSVTIRTACSAAMTGLHMACQALNSGDCQAAIVAGSSLILGPSMTQDMSAQGVLSPMGICKTFDKDADGFGRAEGVNAILIKPLEDAIRDGDPIRAVIRSTAINSDGKTSSMGVPSPESQEVMIRHAYDMAGITDLSKTAFIECHGTGTPTGDPLEAAAVGEVFGEHGVYIGSVKPNLGHTEGASGLTGIIKAVLALEHEIIPPNIHFTTPNPKIPFEKYKLKVPLEPIPWPKDRHARVSVNCFGIGGANAHAILDSAASFGVSRKGVPAVVVSDLDPSSLANGLTNGVGDTNRRPALLCVSACSGKTLTARIADIKNYIESTRSPLNAIAHTLGARRTHLAHRAFCVVDDGDRQTFDFKASKKACVSAPDVAFVFTGQGAQWAGMGRELFSSMPSFRQDIRAMDLALQSLAEPARWKIEDLLCSIDAGKGAINEAEFAQPLSTAVQLAIANLLLKSAVRPSAVVGHSSGEIAAAYVAGALTMSEAIICSYMRGQVTKRQIRPGSMAAVGMSREAVSSFLVPGVLVACQNSPKSVTLSGDADALDSVTQAIKARYGDVFVRKLRVDKAYHSPHMSEVGPDYEALLTPYLSAKVAALPFFSTVSGDLASPGTLFGPAYWRANLESPVLFDSAVQALLRRGKGERQETILIEVGPHSALQGPIRQILQTWSGASKVPTYVPTLVRGESSMRSFLTTLGQLYSYGHSVDLSFVNPAAPPLVDLPAYPWDHSKEFWSESRLSRDWRLRRYPHHELLGSSFPATGGSSLAWRNMLSSRDVLWLKDHMIEQDIVFPCAGYVAMIGEAVRQATGSEAFSYTIRDLVVKTAMVVQESEVLEIMTTMSLVRLTEYTNSSWYEFSISSFNGTSWVQHCIGEAKAGTAEKSSGNTHIASSLPRKVPNKYLYEKLASAGLNFGSRFRLLRDISAHTQKSIARAAVRQVEGENDAEYALHPTAIDALIQLSEVAAVRGVCRHIGLLRVPSRIGLICIHKRSGSSELLAEAVKRSHDAAGQVEITAVTPEQDLVVKLEDVKSIRLDTGQQTRQADLWDRQALGRCHWRPHIDFYGVERTLRPGRGARDNKLILEKIAVLCILRLLGLIESLDVQIPAGHLSKYVSWLRREKESMLRGEYRLVPEAEQWALTDAESQEDLLKTTRVAIDSKGERSASGIVDMFYSILEVDNVKAIFAEEIHPLQLYLESGSLSDFYDYSAKLLDEREFFQLSAHSLPNLKILEVGAGTAATTASILGHLVSVEGTRMYSTYTFTDISSGFFGHARERLAEWEGIEYKVLDITKDPTEQGFTLGEYDLVVASNVIHATPSLHTTLKNVHSLLRPGGRLYMQELITPTFTRCVPFIMGLLPGWWLGEHDGRENQAIASVDRWDQELRVAGFCGVEAAVFDDDDLHKAMAHITSVVPNPADSSVREMTFLYHEEKHLFARELATLFERDGIEVHWSRIGDQESIQGQDVVSTIELERPFFRDISEADYAGFMDLLSRLDGGLLWLTRASQIYCKNPDYGIAIGFARTARVELSMDFWTVELQHLDSPSVDAAAAITRRFLSRPLGEGTKIDCEFSVHEGTVHVGRYDWSSIEMELQSQLRDTDPKQLTVGQPGMLDSLCWVQHTAPTSLKADEIEVDIHCTGLNFRDVMVAMGLLKDQEATLGYEAAGLVTAVGSRVGHVAVRDRVMVIYNGLFATRKVVHGSMAFRIPAELSLEGAATMPIVYCTVIHAVIHKGELERGQSILIHSACGGVGQAALQICKMLGAEVYATVGNEEKAQYLVQEYGLPRERIFSSRNASFYDDVMQATDGRGVDVVLNSLSGDLLHASWRCVAKWGRMMEIGKRDLVERGKLALDMFHDNRTYYGINLDGMFERPQMIRRLMGETIQYFSQGHIKPIRPIRTFSGSRISDAFRYMQSGQHMGKIVVTMPEDAVEIQATKTRQEIAFSNTVTYLLVGGLGGLGKAVASWMVEHGARSLVFFSRSAGNSAEDKRFLFELKSQGCSAIAVAGSVTDMGDVKRAIEAAPTRVAGVMQMSTTVRDLAFFDTAYDDWKHVQDPKVAGTWNLHNAVAGFDLEFFILFSSISAVFGQPGQVNYSAANTFLDSFVQYRHSLGLPCSAIDIGVMDGVGFVGRVHGMMKQFTRRRMALLQEQDLMDALHLCIERSACIGADPERAGYTSSGQIATGTTSSKALADPDNSHPIRGDIRMGLAWQRQSHDDAGTSSDNQGIRDVIKQVASDPGMLALDSTRAQITLEIGRALCGFMLVPEEELDVDMSLASMGVDSLVSIEIRNWWRGTIGVDISVLKITNAGTIARLGDLAVASLREKHGVKEDVGC